MTDANPQPPDNTASEIEQLRQKLDVVLQGIGTKLGYDYSMREVTVAGKEYLAIDASLNQIDYVQDLVGQLITASANEARLELLDLIRDTMWELDGTPVVDADDIERLRGDITQTNQEGNSND